MNTWRLLLGEDAQPADLMQLFVGDSADDDLAAEVTARPPACLLGGYGAWRYCCSCWGAEVPWEWSSDWLAADSTCACPAVRCRPAER